MVENTRIDLGDEDYALLLGELRHKTSRSLNQLLRTTLGAIEYQGLQERLRNAIDEIAKRAILRSIPIEGEDEVILLNQVIEWSFGTVSQESLDNIPSSKYQRLVEEVDKLYSPVPLAVKN